MVAGLQVACEAHIQGGKVLGRPPRKNWKFRPSYTDYIPGTSDFLCRLPLSGHSDSSLLPLYIACAIPHVQ